MIIVCAAVARICTAGVAAVVHLQVPPWGDAAKVEKSQQCNKWTSDQGCGCKDECYLSGLVDAWVMTST